MQASLTQPSAIAHRSLQWDTLAPGLADPVHDSQAIFRVVLDALARPAQIQTLPPHLGQGMADVPSAALAVLYTLCDYATPIWLATAHDALSDALRFHTGAPLAATQDQATFAWIADPAAVPPLANFAQGSAESPELGATVLIQVEAFDNGPALLCRGPGIENSTPFAPRGLRAGIWHERAELATAFPCGVDLLLICGNRLVGLPRTTVIEEV